MKTRLIMKTGARLVTALLLTATFCGLTACSDKDDTATSPDNPITDNMADVTVIFYGCGGGNLDAMTIQNLRDFYKAKPESYKDVKVVMQYKFSKTKSFYPEEEEMFLKDLKEKGEAYMDSTIKKGTYLKWIGTKANSTFRCVLDPGKTLRQQIVDSYLPDENIDFTHPDTIANFIRWAATQCPAKRYVLLLNDHGRGFLPYQEAGDGSFTDYYESDPRTQKSPRRALLDDKGLNKSLTAFKLAQAIRSSGISITTVYFDCCLMNALEYLFEIKDLCRYVVASSYTIQGGGYYSALIDCLAQQSQDFEQRQTEYIKLLSKEWDKKNWDGSSPLYLDVTITRTDRLDRLGEMMGGFVQRLCDTYQNGTDDQRQRIDQVTAKAVRVSDKFDRFDAAKYMSKMLLALPEVFDEQFKQDMQKAFNDCILAQYYSQYLILHAYMVDYTVLLATNGGTFRTMWDANPVNHLDRATLYKADGSIVEYTGEKGYYKSEDDFDYALEKIGESSWGSTLDATFGQLVFDKVTKWSRWLHMNQQQTPLWSKSGFMEEVYPDDDDN